MDGRIRWLMGEVDAWREEGIVTEGTAEQIRERYADEADEPSLAVRSFYILGGVLLAGAVFALFAFLRIRDLISEDGWSPWLMFLGFGALWIALGAVARGQWKNTELSDALLVAGLVQVAALVGPDPGPEILFFAAPVIAAAVLLYQHKEAVIPTAALLVLSGTLPAAWERAGWGDDDFQVGMWLLSAVLVLAGTLAWTRLKDLPWRIPGSVIAGAGAALGWTVFSAETLDARVGFTGDTQVLVAIGLAALLGVGLWLKDRALVYVGGLGLTIDIIVFAFDVGDVEWGLATLIVMSVGLLAVATWLRRRRQLLPQ